MCENWAKERTTQNGLYYPSFEGIEQTDPDALTKQLSRIPMRRAAQPDDVVGKCIYLVSDASNYVTGVDILIDGGYACRK